MDNKPRVAISRCLLGDKVRYDGTDKYATHIVQTLSEYVRFIPICPEAELGLGVPRPPMRLQSDRHGLRLVVIESGHDHTRKMNTFVASRVTDLVEGGIDGYVLKARSPSCGKSVPVYEGANQSSVRQPGLFTAEAQKRSPELPVADEDELSHPDGITRFLESIQARHRTRVGRTEATR